jgi:type II secretory pathway predicted ATPase ExeA
LTPDPEFYFESATHKKALSYLGYGLAQSEGFIVITGEVGAGKSTLAAHLLASIDPAQLTAAQIVTSKLDGQELVHMAARAFGLDVAGHDKAAALARIEAFLHDEARAGRRCLLVVDEAQNLSVARWRNCACCPTSSWARIRCCRSCCSASPSSAPCCKARPGWSSCASG